MKTHSENLKSIVLLVVALSFGIATAANAGNFPGGQRVPTSAGATMGHLPQPQNPKGGNSSGVGGVVSGGGGGGGGALCYDQAPGCHQPF